jgi:hypothetical protein
MNSDLMQKLAVSKKIMDRHNEIPRSSQGGVPNTPQVENFNIPQANYNLPKDVMVESETSQTKQLQTPNKNQVLNSKLPDEIKKLMIENPIHQPQIIGSTDFLSDDIIEGATRLMGKANEPIQETKSQRQHQGQSVPDISSLKQMIRDTVRDTVRDVVREELKSAGFISESETKTNEKLQFKVGKHIFEGIVTKIKKTQ